MLGNHGQRARRAALLLVCCAWCVRAELIGFWPLNCDYEGRDLSGYGLDFSYDHRLPTAPRLQCQDEDGLRGSATFVVSGDLVSLKYLEAVNPGGLHLDLRRAVTWEAYMRLPQLEFTDTNVPIFSFEKSPQVTLADSGLGIVWWNSQFVLVFSGRTQQDRTVSITFGTGMTPNTWYKVAISASLETGTLAYKVTRVRDYLVTAQHTVTDASVTNIAGLMPYTESNIRLGAYAEDNNNNNFGFFRGQLACVRLYNHAMSLADMNIRWTQIPDQCAEGDTVGPCDDASTCAGSALLGQPGYVAGTCALHGDGHTCQCPDGYSYDAAANICADIDETADSNCGCADVCENRLVDRDGVPYECTCTHPDTVLAEDAHSCQEIIPFSASPLYGPEAGGTVIVIRYGFLLNTQASSFPNVVVRLGGARVRPVTLINDTHVTVTTRALGDGDSLTGDETVTLSVKVAGTEVAEGAQFTYKPNPVISDVRPLQAILAGGTLLTVTGTYMDSVSSPMLTVTGVHTTVVDLETGATATSLCTVVDGEVMTCPMPALQVARRRRRQALDEDALAELYIGFQMDGLPTYRNLSEALPDKSRVTVYMNPVFEQFDGVVKYKVDERERLSIQGSSMDLGASLSDYRVLLEDTECADMDLTSNRLSCLPPRKEPSMNRQGAFEKGKIRVNVEVGYYDYYIGQIEYVEDDGVDKGLALVIGASAGGAIAAVLIAIATICCCIRCRQRRLKEDKYKERTRAGEDGRHFDNNMYDAQFQKSMGNYRNPEGKVTARPEPSSPGYDNSDFRMSQNMFVQNDKRDSKDKSSNKKKKSKNKSAAKEEEFFADLMNGKELPSLIKDKDADNKRKQNSYVQDPTRHVQDPTRHVQRNTSDNVKLPHKSNPTHKKGPPPPLPRAPPR